MSTSSKNVIHYIMRMLYLLMRNPLKSVAK